MENIEKAKPVKIKLDFKDSKYATGRRKTSIAKVWLKKGTGKIYVNGKDYNNYFSSENHKMQIVRPFEIINQTTNYDVKWKGHYVQGLCTGLCKEVAKTMEYRATTIYPISDFYIFLGVF